MLWVGIGSILTLVIFVVVVTLGGSEFFKNFDVSVHKKETLESVTHKDALDGAKDKEQNKEYDAQNDQEEPKEKNGEWSDFN